MMRVIIVILILFCININNIFAEDNKESKEQTNKIENNENTEYNGFLTPIAMSLNILPFGLGSLVQGDYTSGTYLLLSDLGIFFTLMISGKRGGMSADSGSDATFAISLTCLGYLLVNRVLGFLVFPLRYHFSMTDEIKKTSSNKSDNSLNETEEKSPVIAMSLNVLPLGIGSLYQGDTSGFITLLAFDTISIITFISGITYFSQDTETIICTSAVLLFSISRALGIFVFPFTYADSIKKAKNSSSPNTSQIASYNYYKDFHGLISEKSNVPSYRKIQDKLKIELPLVNMNF